MNTFDINYLKNKNFHENDKGTSLNEETHIYNIQGEYDYTSMTTFIHSLFNTFDADKIITNMMNSKNWVNSKYYGMTREEIKELWDKNKREKKLKNCGIKIKLMLQKMELICI
jgi:hypothetical protein